MNTDTGSPRIEEEQSDLTDNAEKILFAAIQYEDLVFVGVIYDAEASQGGGKGGATVNATCNGGICSQGDIVAAVTPGAFLSGLPATLSWNPCCEEGFVLGPFIASENVCFEHSNLSKVSTARFVTGGQTRTFYVIAADASTDKICISFA